MTFNAKSIQDWGIFVAFVVQTVTLAVSLALAAGRIDTRVSVLEERVGNCVASLDKVEKQMQSQSFRDLANSRNH